MNLTLVRNIFFAGLMILAGCEYNQEGKKFYYNSLNHAVEQTKLLVADADQANRIPRTLDKKGHMHWTKEKFDWTEGFFPGTCWYLYEYTGDQIWKEKASNFQNLFKNHRFITSNHDLGFVFNCSYGQDYRINKSEEAKNVLIDAANSLITRFNPEVGCIQSWDVDGGWQAKRGWQFPVIIDNMMNLELLFTVSEITGDDKYSDIAISHADVTLRNHFREDNSSYHVIDYDSINGNVRQRETAQGYAHESRWARGQAWGLYGYTVCYRYTKDKKYLKQAKKIADFILNYEGMPKDMIPYWDYNAGKIPNEPRDVSAAAITASALIELNQYTNQNYIDPAVTILNNLSSSNYLAEIGSNKNFVLMHSVGSIPHNNEIDVPLIYADYYFVEALTRLTQNDNTHDNTNKSKSN